jgi:hypothetical protein
VAPDATAVGSDEFRQDHMARLEVVYFMVIAVPALQVIVSGDEAPNSPGTECSRIGRTSQRRCDCGTLTTNKGNTGFGVEDQNGNIELRVRRLKPAVKDSCTKRRHLAFAGT